MAMAEKGGMPGQAKCCCELDFSHHKLLTLDLNHFSHVPTFGDMRLSLVFGSLENITRVISEKRAFECISAEEGSGHCLGVPLFSYHECVSNDACNSEQHMALVHNWTS